MESLDKEYGSAMGALFHQVITDMKVQAESERRSFVEREIGDRAPSVRHGASQ